MMHYLILITGLILLFYACLTFGLLYHWEKIPISIKRKVPDPIFMTIIVPVRNESENILNLIQDLESQTYPKHLYEVLIMNDGSTDNTKELVLSRLKSIKSTIKLINLENEATKSPKKRAIEQAIGVAKGSLITTTDGDCRMGKNWLSSIANHYQHTKNVIISGPVTFFDHSNLFTRLQIIEFASLVASGGGTLQAGFPTMCNGANLTYEKQAFLEVNGFAEVDHIASGDDEFLMHKLSLRFPKKLGFLKSQDAIVYTHSHQNLANFRAQRQRWASKWKHYQSATPKLLAVFIFTANFLLLLLAGLFGIGAISTPTFLVLLALKWIPEWFFLVKVLLFLNQTKSLKFILLTQFIYPFYICFFGLLGQKEGYQWKGRALK